jgi:type I restriction enzyme M protein
MFRRLTIRNYRSIEESEVTLAPFVTVVGQNGSGKSNFADALVFLRDISFDASAAITSRGGITSVRRWSKSKPYDVSIELRVAPTRDELDEHYVMHSFTIASGNEGAWRFKRECIRYVAASGGWSIDRKNNQITVKGMTFHVEHLPETVSAMLFARQLAKLPGPFRAGLFGVKRYRFNPDGMRQPQLVTESGRLSETGDNLATAVLRLREAPGQGFVQVLASMKRIIPGLRDIRPVVAGRHQLIEFEQEQASGTATFSASEVSEGALRALGIIIAAKQMVKNELLIIEEPEANIHAGAAGLVFDVLKDASRKGAVLMTTHSPELLDAARDEDILVCSYRDGVTKLGPLDKGQRALVRKGLFSLAELMRSEPLRIEGEQPHGLSP